MDGSVRDVMTRDVVVVSPADGWLTALRRVMENGVHGLPVVDDDGRVVGMVTEADLALKEELAPEGLRAWLPHQSRRDRRRAAASTVQEAMTAPPVVVGPDCSIADAARTMHRRHVGRLPVVDGDGRLVGIVSRSDLLRVFLRGDDDLATAVRAAVREADAPEVVVEVTDGVVHLRGDVQRRSTAARAEKAAKGVLGVVAVRCGVRFDVDDLDLVIYGG